MKRQRVTLEIVYDDTEQTSPRHWDWNALIEPTWPGESVTLVAHDPVEPVLPDWVRDRLAQDRPGR